MLVDKVFSRFTVFSRQNWSFKLKFDKPINIIFQKFFKYLFFKYLRKNAVDMNPNFSTKFFFT